MPTLPGYYTTAEAAEKLGYASTSTLAALCQQGKILGATKIGKTWLIPEKWVGLAQNKQVTTGGRGKERK